MFFDSMISFEDKVLNITKKIPQGRIITYKFIARALGKPKAFRAVGRALNKNKKLIKIPCHRVVKSNGTLGGYAEGKKRKKNLLKKEGILIKENKIIGFEKIIFKF